MVAPHTTNFDFILSMGYIDYWGRNVNYMAKKELFKWPLGILMRGTGSIPIDRSKNLNVVQQMAEEFAKRDELILIIAAEGTRRAVKKWKTGFYHIAKEANVPLWVGKIDAKNKSAGVFKEQSLEGSKEDVMKQIQAYYANIEALDPKGWNPDFL